MRVPISNAVDEAKPNRGEPIPAIVHFIFGLSDDPAQRVFTFAHYAAVQAAHDLLQPAALWLHYAHLPSGAWFELAAPGPRPSARYGHTRQPRSAAALQWAPLILCGLLLLLHACRYGHAAAVVDSAETVGGRCALDGPGLLGGVAGEAAGACSRLDPSRPLATRHPHTHRAPAPTQRSPDRHPCSQRCASPRATARGSRS